MFDALFSKLLGEISTQTRRAEGVAFFRVAKDLYGLKSVDYLGLNVPLASSQGRYAHCIYSDAGVRHCISGHPIGIDLIRELGLRPSDPISWNPADLLADCGVEDEQQALTFPLRPRVGEFAIFGVTVARQPGWAERSEPALRELRVLANYFHGHVLRMNGHNCDNDILMSARELDCLKWTAAGKTAWEASVILGISERTVRFHLNAAREKLECATTTQAVAKAIVNQLIEV